MEEAKHEEGRLRLMYLYRYVGWSMSNSAVNSVAKSTETDGEKKREE